MLQSNLATKAEQLNLRFARLPAESLLKEVFAHGLLGRAALVSSFGGEAAVLLHMLSKIAPNAPILFIDTELLFPETLAYQAELAARFQLSNVQILRADTTFTDPKGRLHSSDPEACCALRKTAPLQAALAPYAAWASGRKRFQGGARSTLELFEAEHGTGRIKLNPLANWSPKQITSYFESHDLPRHALTAKGYGSLGCAPCTSPAKGRAGRWQDRAKTECGIHLPAPTPKGENA